MNKRKLPLLFAFGFGVIPIIAFFVNHKKIKDFSSGLDQWMIIIAGFALLLGIVNVTQLNIGKIKRKESGWFYSVVLLTSMLVMTFFGFFGSLGYFGGIGFRDDGSSTPFNWISTTMFIPLQSTMFALLAFYIASAAYRAFRAHNVEATILLVAGIIVMLGRIPFGDMLFAWLPIESPLSRLTEWIMDKPNSAAQRGIIIGAALGAASMSLKVILGIERSYLGSERE